MTIGRGRGPLAGAAAPGGRPPRPPLADLGVLQRDLVAPEGRPFARPAWLDDAAADPAGFWARVGPALLAAPFGSSRSTLFERYPLAHELGARHASGRSAAFKAFDEAFGFQDLTYARAVEGARALAAAWRARGVESGMAIALVAPLSPELLVGLLAAWHLGAVPAPVPVWGRTYVRDRLTALAPDFVAASRGRALWLELPEEQRLATAANGAEGEPGGPHPYAPDEPALRVFSPLGDAPLAPVNVPAERLYLGALRDGALFFGLGADLGLAAPGCCEAQVALPLLFACLATGAHFISINADDACARPQQLCGGRVHVLGMDARLRDAFLAADPRVDGPARWFRSPAAAHEPERWGHLAQARAFARAQGTCYFPSPAAGGALTWAPWRRAPSLNLALPAPGLPWQLVDPGRGGALASDGNGMLMCGDPALSPEVLGRPLLGRVAGEALWVASVGAHRDGQRLPAAEIEALVARQRPEVWACGLVDDARVGAVLVVFAWPERIGEAAGARDAFGRAVAEAIAVELAPHLVPDRVEVFTLAPRTAGDGSLDRDWCRGQHVTGRLVAKQAEPVFRAIARLRQAMEESAPAR